MKARSLRSARWLRQSRLDTLCAAVLLALGAAAPAQADTVDGRNIPEWSNSKILLPALALGENLYSAELRLASNSGEVVLEVFNPYLVQAGGVAGKPHDHAAHYEGNKLTIPVFKSNGLYYAAELEPLVANSPGSKYFRLKNLWQVEPARLSVPIEGLDYVSGSKQDVTDSQGRFYAVVGSPVDFNIGALDLGNTASAISAGTVPYDALFPLGDDSPGYVRSLQVLGLLDSDNNSVNGIQISPATKLAAANALAATSLTSLNFNNQYATLAVAAKGVNAGAVAYEPEAAKINFQKLEIQSYMLSQLAEKSIPGVSLAIELPNGEMWHTAAGVANVATGEAMTPAHRFRIGSATKSFTAMLIMQLVDEGKLTLDDKLEEYFPGKFPDGDLITIKMLLNHTAGIFSFTDAFPGFEEVFGVTLDVPLNMTDLWFVRYIGMPGYIYGPGELIDIGAAVNSAFAKNNATEQRPYLINAPGEAWNYSNTHYVLLQEIAEMLTGKLWEDEIRERFVEPLGLSNTVVPTLGDLFMTGTYAHGYINWADNQGDYVADLFGFPHTDVERSHTDPSYTMGSGAMISTAGDLAKWANAVMEGQLLSPATQALMREPFQVGDAFGEGINMLQGVVQELGLQVFGHRGQIAGYDASWQYHYRDPNDVIGTGTAMAVLLNRTLLTEFNPDGSPYISNVNEVMLAGILDILYDE